MENNQPERMWTVEEMAEYLGMTEYTIRKYLREGEIVGKRLKREWRVLDSEFQRFLNK